MNSKNPIKDVIIGVIVGIIGVCVGTVLWIICLSDTDIVSTLKNAYAQKLLAPIISAGALVNLGAMFLFIKQNKNYQARGVIISTLFVALFVVVRKLS